MDIKLRAKSWAYILCITYTQEDEKDNSSEGKTARKYLSAYTKHKYS